MKDRELFPRVPASSERKDAAVRIESMGTEGAGYLGGKLGKLESRLSLEKRWARMTPWGPSRHCPSCPTRFLPPPDEAVWRLNSRGEYAFPISTAPGAPRPPAGLAVYSRISRAHTSMEFSTSHCGAPSLFKCPLNLWSALPKEAWANFCLRNVALLNPTPGDSSRDTWHFRKQ